MCGKATFISRFVEFQDPRLKCLCKKQSNGAIEIDLNSD